MSKMQYKNCRNLAIALFLIFILIFLFKFSKAININEINFNPLNQTYADEYIELYSFKGFNLNNFTICDLTSCDNLTLYKWLNTSFTLITTNQSNYKDVNASIYFVSDSRIGNGLNNDGDCIYLYHQGLLIDMVCYNKSVEKGNSLQFVNGEWQECSITPGKENNCSESEDFKIYFPKFILNKNKNFVVLIDAKNKARLYDVKIDVKANDERLSKIWDENSSEWKSTYYYINSINLSNKSFILKIESDYHGDALAEIKIRDIKTYLFSVKIIDNFVEEQQEQSPNQNKNESEIELLDFPNETTEGNIIKIKLRVYRGDTRKYAVYAYLYDTEKEKKISEQTVFYANEKFKNYTLTLPTVIKEIDQSKYYSLVVEGLGLNVKEKIFVNNIEQNENNDKNKLSKSNENNQQYFYSFNNFDVYFNFDKNVGKNFSIDVELNNKGKPKYFYIWSYVYSGSHCISCEKSKDENYLKVFLNENESKSIKLKDNLVKDAFGFYKLKIEVMEEGEKIPKEFSFDVFVNTTKVKQIKKLIFEGKNDRNFRYVGYLLVTLFLLILIIVIFKKQL